MEVRTLHDNLLSEINGVVYLLSRLVWFHRLNIDPDLPVVTGWTPSLILEFSLLAGLVVLAALTGKRRPWIRFGVIWFFLTLLPTNSVMPRLDIANERHLYLANFGVFIPVGVELSRLGVFDRKWAKAGVVALLSLLACFTVIRNGVYRTNITLWEDTALKSPHKSRVFNNLGLSYELDGQPPGRAVALFEKAVRLNPDNAIARKNLMRYKTAGVPGIMGAAP
jgi:hypothetical protein